jgi:hypothetical protein
MKLETKAVRHAQAIDFKGQSVIGNGNERRKNRRFVSLAVSSRFLFVSIIP